VPRKLFHRTDSKLNSLRQIPILKKRGAIAHYTSTIPGVACLPDRRTLQRLQRFKRRRGPFLLLADSVATTRRLIRWYTAGLRKLIRTEWPGRTTLIVPGRPGLPKEIYEKGRIAIRVDADPACRRLARAAGGLLLSSSLNRRGEMVRNPDCTVQFRWHLFLNGRASLGTGSGAPSKLYRVSHRGQQRFR